MLRKCHAVSDDKAHPCLYAPAQLIVWIIMFPCSSRVEDVARGYSGHHCSRLLARFESWRLGGVSVEDYGLTEGLAVDLWSVRIVI